MIEVIALVNELGKLRAHDESMRETSRNENLSPIVGRQYYANPAPEVPRPNTDVDRDIEDFTRHDSA